MAPLRWMHKPLRFSEGEGSPGGFAISGLPGPAVEGVARAVLDGLWADAVPVEALLAPEGGWMLAALLEALELPLESSPLISLAADALMGVAARDVGERRACALLEALTAVFRWRGFGEQPGAGVSGSAGEGALGSGSWERDAGGAGPAAPWPGSAHAGQARHSGVGAPRGSSLLAAGLPGAGGRASGDSLVLVWGAVGADAGPGAASHAPLGGEGLGSGGPRPGRPGQPDQRPQPGTPEDSLSRMLEGTEVLLWACRRVLEFYARLARGDPRPAVRATALRCQICCYDFCYNAVMYQGALLSCLEAGASVSQLLALDRALGRALASRAGRSRAAPQPGSSGGGSSRAEAGAAGEAGTAGGVGASGEERGPAGSIGPAVPAVLPAALESRGGAWKEDASGSGSGQPPGCGAEVNSESVSARAAAPGSVYSSAPPSARPAPLSATRFSRSRAEARAAEQLPWASRLAAQPWPGADGGAEPHERSDLFGAPRIPRQQEVASGARPSDDSSTLAAPTGPLTLVAETGFLRHSSAFNPSSLSRGSLHARHPGAVWREEGSLLSSQSPRLRAEPVLAQGIQGVQGLQTLQGLQGPRETSGAIHHSLPSLSGLSGFSAFSSLPASGRMAVESHPATRRRTADRHPQEARLIREAPRDGAGSPDRALEALVERVIEAQDRMSRLALTRVGGVLTYRWTFPGGTTFSLSREPRRARAGGRAGAPSFLDASGLFGQGLGPEARGPRGSGGIGARTPRQGSRGHRSRRKPRNPPGLWRALASGLAAELAVQLDFYVALFAGLPELFQQLDLDPEASSRFWALLPLWVCGVTNPAIASFYAFYNRPQTVSFRPPSLRTLRGGAYAGVEHYCQEGAEPAGAEGSGCSPGGWRSGDQSGAPSAQTSAQASTQTSAQASARAWPEEEERRPSVLETVRHLPVAPERRAGELPAARPLPLGAPSPAASRSPRPHSSLSRSLSQSRIFSDSQSSLLAPRAAREDSSGDDGEEIVVSLAPQRRQEEALATGTARVRVNGKWVVLPRPGPGAAAAQAAPEGAPAKGGPGASLSASPAAPRQSSILPRRRGAGLLDRAAFSSDSSGRESLCGELAGPEGAEGVEGTEGAEKTASARGHRTSASRGVHKSHPASGSSAHLGSSTPFVPSGPPSSRIPRSPHSPHGAALGVIERDLISSAPRVRSLSQSSRGPIRALYKGTECRIAGEPASLGAASRFTFELSYPAVGKLVASAEWAPHWRGGGFASSGSAPRGLPGGVSRSFAYSLAPWRGAEPAVPEDALPEDDDSNVVIVTSLGPRVPPAAGGEDGADGAEGAECVDTILDGILGCPAAPVPSGPSGQSAPSGPSGPSGSTLSSVISNGQQGRSAVWKDQFGSGASKGSRESKESRASVGSGWRGSAATVPSFTVASSPLPETPGAASLGTSVSSIFRAASYRAGGLLPGQPAEEPASRGSDAAGMVPAAGSAGGAETPTPAVGGWAHMSPGERQALKLQLHLDIPGAQGRDQGGSLPRGPLRTENPAAASASEAQGAREVRDSPLLEIPVSSISNGFSRPLDGPKRPERERAPCASRTAATPVLRSIPFWHRFTHGHAHRVSEILTVSLLAYLFGPRRGGRDLPGSVRMGAGPDEPGEAGSSSARGARGERDARGSQASRTSRASRSSHASRASHVSHASAVSHISHASHTSRTQRARDTTTALRHLTLYQERATPHSSLVFSTALFRYALGPEHVSIFFHILTEGSDRYFFSCLRSVIRALFLTAEDRPHSQTPSQSASQTVSQAVSQAASQLGSQFGSQLGNHSANPRGAPDVTRVPGPQSTLLGALEAALGRDRAESSARMNWKHSWRDPAAALSALNPALRHSFGLVAPCGGAAPPVPFSPREGLILELSESNSFFRSLLPFLRISRDGVHVQTLADIVADFAARLDAAVNAAEGRGLLADAQLLLDGESAVDTQMSPKAWADARRCLSGSAALALCELARNLRAAPNELLRTALGTIVSGLRHLDFVYHAAVLASADVLEGFPVAVQFAAAQVLCRYAEVSPATIDAALRALAPSARPAHLTRSARRQVSDHLSRALACKNVAHMVEAGRLGDARQILAASALLVREELGEMRGNLSGGATASGTGRAHAVGALSGLDYSSLLFRIVDFVDTILALYFLSNEDLDGVPNLVAVEDALDEDAGLAPLLGDWLRHAGLVFSDLSALLEACTPESRLSDCFLADVKGAWEMLFALLADYLCDMLWDGGAFPHAVLLAVLSVCERAVGPRSRMVFRRHSVCAGCFLFPTAEVHCAMRALLAGGGRAEFSLARRLARLTRRFVGEAVAFSGVGEKCDEHAGNVGNAEHVGQQDLESLLRKLCRAPATPPAQLERRLSKASEEGFLLTVRCRSGVLWPDRAFPPPLASTSSAISASSAVSASCASARSAHSAHSATSSTPWRAPEPAWLSLTVYSLRELTPLAAPRVVEDGGVCFSLASLADGVFKAGLAAEAGLPLIVNEMIGVFRSAAVPGAHQDGSLGDEGGFFQAPRGRSASSSAEAGARSGQGGEGGRGFRELRAEQEQEGWQGFFDASSRFAPNPPEPPGVSSAMRTSQISLADPARPDPAFLESTDWNDRRVQAVGSPGAALSPAGTLAEARDSPLSSSASFFASALAERVCGGACPARPAPGSGGKARGSVHGSGARTPARRSRGGTPQLRGSMYSTWRSSTHRAEVVREFDLRSSGQEPGRAHRVAHALHSHSMRSAHSTQSTRSLHSPHSLRSLHSLHSTHSALPTRPQSDTEPSSGVEAAIPRTTALSVRPGSIGRDAPPRPAASPAALRRTTLERLEAAGRDLLRDAASRGPVPSPAPTPAGPWSSFADAAFESGAESVRSGADARSRLAESSAASEWGMAAPGPSADDGFLRAALLRGPVSASLASLRPVPAPRPKLDRRHSLSNGAAWRLVSRPAELSPGSLGGLAPGKGGAVDAFVERQGPTPRRNTVDYGRKSSILCFSHRRDARARRESPSGNTSRQLGDTGSPASSGSPAPLERNSPQQVGAPSVGDLLSVGGEEEFAVSFAGRPARAGVDPRYVPSRLSVSATNTEALHTGTGSTLLGSQVSAEWSEARAFLVNPSFGQVSRGGPSPPGRADLSPDSQGREPWAPESELVVLPSEAAPVGASGGAGAEWDAAAGWEGAADPLARISTVTAVMAFLQHSDARISSGRSSAAGRATHSLGLASPSVAPPLDPQDAQPPQESEPLSAQFSAFRSAVEAAGAMSSIASMASAVSAASLVGSRAGSHAWSRRESSIGPPPGLHVSRASQTPRVSSAYPQSARGALPSSPVVAAPAGPFAFGGAGETGSPGGPGCPGAPDTFLPLGRIRPNAYNTPLFLPGEMLIRRSFRPSRFGSLTPGVFLEAKTEAATLSGATSGLSRQARQSPRGGSSSSQGGSARPGEPEGSAVPSADGLLSADVQSAAPIRSIESSACSADHSVKPLVEAVGERCELVGRPSAGSAPVVPPLDLRFFGRDASDGRAGAATGRIPLKLLRDGSLPAEVFVGGPIEIVTPEGASGPETRRDGRESGRYGASRLPYPEFRGFAPLELLTAEAHLEQCCSAAIDEYVHLLAGGLAYCPGTAGIGVGGGADPLAGDRGGTSGIGGVSGVPGVSGISAGPWYGDSVFPADPSVIALEALCGAGEPVADLRPSDVLDGAASAPIFPDSGPCAYGAYSPPRGPQESILDLLPEIAGRVCLEGA